MDAYEASKYSERKSVGQASNEGSWYSQSLTEINERLLPELAKLLKEMETPLILWRILLFDGKAETKFDKATKTVSSLNF